MSSPTPRKPVPKNSRTEEVLHATSHGPVHHDEHVEEPSEKWLVAYADLMTLLFGFFVLMYSMSNVDQQKFSEAAASASERFGVKDGGGFGGGYQDPTENIDRALAKQVASIPGAAQDVEVKKNRMGLEINFRGKVLFESGSAEISTAGRSIIVQLGKQLLGMKDAFEIRVEGHTDDVPISTAQFPSNWELSASRAIQVIKIFREIGLPEKKLEAIGYADTRPIADNRSPAGEVLPENMSQNRRVMLKIQRVFK